MLPARLSPTIQLNCLFSSFQCFPSTSFSANLETSSFSTFILTSFFSICISTATSTFSSENSFIFIHHQKYVKFLFITVTAGHFILMTHTYKTCTVPVLVNNECPSKFESILDKPWEVDLCILSPTQKLCRFVFLSAFVVPAHVE